MDVLYLPPWISGSFATINEFSFSIYIFVLSMYLNVLNEDCNLLYNLNNNKLQISLLLLFMQWNRQFHHQLQSLQIHNYKYLNSRPTFSFILQKPHMLLKEGNRFWEEGLPYGKQAQEKSKHRIKHMEKCLYGINQVSLMEVIFGLSWLLFMSLSSNCLHFIFYQCWGKRKKVLKWNYRKINKCACMEKFQFLYEITFRRTLIQGMNMLPFAMNWLFDNSLKYITRYRFFFPLVVSKFALWLTFSNLKNSKDKDNFS